MRNGKSGLFVKKRVHYLTWLRAQDEELINKSISENHKHLAKSLKNKISSACTKKKKKKTQSTEMNLYKSQQQLPKCSLINTIFTQFRNLWEMGKLKKLMLTQSTQPFTLII